MLLNTAENNPQFDRISVCRSTDERLASMGYRKLVVKNYIAFFTIDEKSKIVDVARILYERRDWLRIL